MSVPMCQQRLRVRALMILMGMMALVVLAVLAASAFTIYRAKDHLVSEVRHDAQERARAAAERILQVMRQEAAGSLSDIVNHPEVRAQINTVTQDELIAVTSVADPAGTVLFQQYCPKAFPNGLPMMERCKRDCKAPGLDEFQWEFREAELPAGVVPVSLTIERGPERLGTLLVGVCSVVATGRANELGAMISTSLTVMLSVTAILISFAMVLLYLLFIRVMAMQQRTAQAQHLASIGTIAQGLAHEIRNPLSAMSMRLECVQEELSEQDAPADEGGASSAIEAVRRQIGGLERTVAGFVRFASPLSMEPETVNLRGVLTSTLGDLASKVEAAGITATVDVDAALAAHGDEASLRQICHQVLLNSIQALESSERREITITARRRKKSLVLKIEDSGPGFPDDLDARLAAGVVTRPCGGMGFGLALARRLAEQHRGALVLGRSETLGGAMVKVTLPVCG